MQVFVKKCLPDCLLTVQKTCTQASVAIQRFSNEAVWQARDINMWVFLSSWAFTDPLCCIEAERWRRGALSDFLCGGNWPMTGGLQTMTAASFWGGFDVVASLNRTPRHSPSTTCGSLVLWFWHKGLFFFSPPVASVVICDVKLKTGCRPIRAALKRTTLCLQDSVLTTALGLDQPG